MRMCACRVPARAEPEPVPKGLAGSNSLCRRVWSPHIRVGFFAFPFSRLLAYNLAAFWRAFFSRLGRRFLFFFSSLGTLVEGWFARGVSVSEVGALAVFSVTSADSSGLSFFAMVRTILNGGGERPCWLQLGKAFPACACRAPSLTRSRSSQTRR